MNPEFKMFIERLKKGADNVLFRDVVEAASGRKILDISESYNPIIDTVKEYLKASIKKISDSVEKNYEGRANELSNFMEPIVRKFLNEKSDFKAEIPSLKEGVKQSAGYPDIILMVKDKKIYIEIKTYQKKTMTSSLRSFYFKPSEKNKIQYDAPHIILGFEVESKGGSNKSPFIIKGFKLINLFDLMVSLKPEFNANNRDLYTTCEEL